MAYNRQPQTVLAGMALKQNPPPTILQPAGIVAVTLDAEIATTTTPGVVQVGSGLTITPEGVLSAINGDHECCFMRVYLTSKDYTATDDDCYIGAIENDKEDGITITLPKGMSGKVYTVKNQDKGNVKVQGSVNQKIDTSTSKTLGSQASITVVFDGTRWNTI